MNKTQSNARRAAIVLCAVSIPLLAAACGGSSKSAGASTRAAALSTITASTSRSAPPTRPSAPGGTAARSTSGSGASTRSASAPGASQGNASAGHQATSTKSRHTSPPRHESKPANGYSPALKSAVSTFVSCMDGHGIHLPAPNFSGGPNEILSDKGINNNTPQFQSAMNACGADLIAILRAGGASIAPGG